MATTPDSSSAKCPPLKSPSASSQTNLMIPPNSGRASDSLHSSNDSGFSNDLAHSSSNNNGNNNAIPAPPPPQPDIDYSDDEPPPPTPPVSGVR